MSEALPIPICVVGAGLIGLRHIEVAQKSPNVELAAVVEPNADLMAALATQGLPVFAELGDIPKSIQAAIIATPTPVHAASAHQAIDSGMAVLVEKPLTATLAQGRDLVAAAERAGVPMITGHHRRCHPFTIAARDAIAQLGGLVAAQGFWSLRKNDSYYDMDWRRKPGAGPIMTNLSHEIDLLQFLVGPIVEITCLTSNAQRGFMIEDTASIAMRFENGALGSFIISDAGASPWSFEAASSENPNIAGSGADYMRFSGQAAAMEFPSLTLWKQAAEGEVEWSKPMTPNPRPKFHRVDPIAEQLDRFMRYITDGPDGVLCDARQGLDAMEMTLAAAYSAKMGRPIQRGQVPLEFEGT